MWVAALFAVIVAPGGCDDDEAKRAEPKPMVQEPDPSSSLEQASRLAFERGLGYLAREQARTVDGSFPKGNAQEWAPIGVTALGALAFLSAGNSPDRGPYGREVARAVDYLLAHTDLTPGSREHGYISNQGDSISRMHGHGFATLTLAQVYGMTPGRHGAKNQRLKKALTAAVRLIESAQGPEGGWYYDPRPSGHEGSVTICLVQALRAARNVGVQVDPAGIVRAEDYVLALRNDAGLFRYQLDRNDASVALTAAAIGTLNAAGRYDDAVIRDSVEAIWTRLELRAQEGKPSRRRAFRVYERLYLAQAFWQLSDTSHFERWFEEERARLVRTQNEDGSWSNPEYGTSYATAVHCLVLAVPDGLLPIFQR
ncbi:MAG: terpene cyclase/mutase family protein [Planctomycetota bacterium]|nr:terpene cyclase/mutase family protein [Planctomycetota bacterium]